MFCEQHQTRCEERFKLLEDHLERLTADHHKLVGDVRVSNERITQLTKTLAALTKALWGLVASLFTALAGFFIWYIQTHA